MRVVVGVGGGAATKRWDQAETFKRGQRNLVGHGCLAPGHLKGQGSPSFPFPPLGHYSESHAMGCVCSPGYFPIRTRELHNLPVFFSLLLCTPVRFLSGLLGARRKAANRLDYAAWLAAANIVAVEWGASACI